MPKIKRQAKVARQNHKPVTKQDVIEIVEASSEKMAQMIGRGFSGVDNRFLGLESDVSEIKTRLTYVEHDVSETKYRLISVENDVSEIKLRQQNVAYNFEIKALDKRVTKLETKQDRK